MAKSNYVIEFNLVFNSTFKVMRLGFLVIGRGAREENLISLISSSLCPEKVQRFVVLRERENFHNNSRKNRQHTDAAWQHLQ